MNIDLDFPAVSLVSSVASEFEEATSAKKVLRDAEVVFLTKMIELVRPALRSLVTRPRISDLDYVGVSRAGKYETADWAGLKVAGDRCQDGGSQDSSGSYEGSALYLLADGSFRDLTYSGSWTRWQGGTDSWSAEVTLYADVRAVLDGWELSDIVNSLNAALAEQAGSRKESTKRTLERAEKLRALSDLIG